MSQRKTEMLKIFDEHAQKIRTYINEEIDGPGYLMHEEVIYWNFDDYMVELKGCLMGEFLKHEPNQEETTDETFYKRLLDKGTDEQIEEYLLYYPH